MEVSLIKIGNSRGIRLSKTLLDQYDFRDKVELVLEQGFIILKPTSTPREGWEEAFKEMNKQGDDQLIFSDIFEDEDPSEWE